MLPQEILEIRCSEIASEVILGQKQSPSSYMARGVFHPIFGFPWGQKGGSSELPQPPRLRSWVHMLYTPLCGSEILPGIIRWYTVVGVRDYVTSII